MKIFKLVTEGTVDEMLYLRQVYKCVRMSLCAQRKANMIGQDSGRG